MAGQIVHPNIAYQGSTDVPNSKSFAEDLSNALIWLVQQTFFVIWLKFDVNFAINTVNLNFQKIGPGFHIGTPTSHAPRRRYENKNVQRVNRTFLEFNVEFWFKFYFSKRFVSFVDADSCPATPCTPDGSDQLQTMLMAINSVRLFIFQISFKFSNLKLSFCENLFFWRFRLMWSDRPCFWY